MLLEQPSEFLSRQLSAQALVDAENESKTLHDRLQDSWDKLSRVEGKINDAEAETHKVVSERDAHAQTIGFMKVGTLRITLLEKKERTKRNLNFSFAYTSEVFRGKH